MTGNEEYELVLPAGVLRLTIAAATDLGNVRKVNEDSYLAEFPLFLVADGMGGHSFGDRASQSVVSTFASAATDGVPPVPELVIQTIHDANQAIIDLSSEGDAVSGTTLSGVALVAVGAERVHHWMAFNVGDSRVYSWDGRRLEQVTVDHSAIQELLDLGHITALEAAEHPHRNVVTRAMGVHEVVDPDVWLLPVGGRQVFLICSDGLTKELDDDLIEGLLTDQARLEAGQNIAERLVEAALASGGRDNVTVVVVESELVGSELVGPAHAVEDTAERGMPSLLEDTIPSS